MPATATFQLSHRTLHDLPDAAGIEVRVTQGCVWLTLDHDPRDIVLAAGESFLTTEHRRGLIYALQPSTVILETAPAAAPAMLMRAAHA